MKFTRSFQSQPLALGKFYVDEDSFHHLARVLRLKIGEGIELFNGDNYIYRGKIIELNKKNLAVDLTEKHFKSVESPLKIHLGQVISRGEKMEFTIQKAVELGVSEITPLISSRCGVRLNDERMAKKLEQWQKIAISAMEQSGRNLLVKINPIAKLEEWVNTAQGIKLNLDPRGACSLKELTLNLAQDPLILSLLIGSEGGLDQNEIENCNQQGFQSILLGPRILRTETAALSVISALQLKFGDF